jgi:hypothetical protein
LLKERPGSARPVAVGAGNVLPADDEVNGLVLTALLATIATLVAVELQLLVGHRPSPRILGTLRAGRRAWQRPRLGHLVSEHEAGWTRATLAHQLFRMDAHDGPDDGYAAHLRPDDESAPRCGVVTCAEERGSGTLNRLPDAPCMDDEVMTTQELLEQWREATRAAELAERLARMAAESVQRSDQNAAGAQEIARMAERAAKSAERAAKSARAAADRAARFAAENRSGTLADADQTVIDAREEEAAARDRYHQAEAAARARHTPEAKAPGTDS